MVDAPSLESQPTAVNTALKWLQEPYKRIRVFPERDFQMNRAEVIVIDTEPVQRLRRLKQLGFSHLVWPTAEHTRFAHSLGSAYWSAKFLHSIRTGHFAEGNRQLLDEAQATIGPTLSFNLLVRLYALLHDLTHLAFGHTLEDQLKLYPRHDEDEARIDLAFQMLEDQIIDSPILNTSPHEDTIGILKRHLELVRAVLEVDRLLHEDEGAKLEMDSRTFAALCLVHDITSNTICTDLVDYSLRDSQFASMPRTFDKVILGHLQIVDRPAIDDKLSAVRRRFGGETRLLRLSLNAVRKKLRHDVLTGVISLLRIRYELAEKIYFHHAKCAADAMLDFVARRVELPKASTELLPLGDEEFLGLLGSRAEDAGEAIKRTFLNLRRRRLPKEVYRLTGYQALQGTAKTLVDSLCASPSARTQLEDRFADALDLGPGDVLVSVRPVMMQMKQAKALIGWTDGRVLPLNMLEGERGYQSEIGHLTRRYLELWSLSVYLPAEHLMRAPALIRLAESRDFFETKNDDTLQRSLESDERLREAFEAARAFDVLGREAMTIRVGRMAARLDPTVSYEADMETAIRRRREKTATSPEDSSADQRPASAPKSLSEVPAALSSKASSARRRKPTGRGSGSVEESSVPMPDQKQATPTALFPAGERVRGSVSEEDS